MQMFLLKMSQMLMGGTRFLATATSGGADLEKTSTTFTGIVDNIASFIDALLLPLMILVLSAGTVYAVVLGVNFSRAETSDKREEAKKRLINAIIGIVIIFVLLLLLKILTTNMPTILDALGYKK